MSEILARLTWKEYNSGDGMLSINIPHYFINKINSHKCAVFNIDEMVAIVDSEVSMELIQEFTDSFTINDFYVLSLEDHDRLVADKRLEDSKIDYFWNAIYSYSDIVDIILDEYVLLIPMDLI